MSTRRKLLGQILKERGLVDEGQIQEALKVQRDHGGPLGKILIERGHITAADLHLALGIQQGLEVVDLQQAKPSKELAKRIDASSARLFQVVPIREEAGALVVAIADPLNSNFLDELRFLVGSEVRAVMADPQQLVACLDEFYGEATPANALAEAVDEFRQGGDTTLDLSDREGMAHAGPVVKLLNFILFQAVRDQASDIHLEPFETEFKIRYRVDGVLYELEPPPVELAVPLISRVKVMANLDIAETRIPQDGRIELSIDGRAVDLRVSTLPTLHGESCVLRVLDRSVVALDLERIGLTARDREQVEGLLALPHGIILVTGPTGSGKTTTLYSMLNQLNDTTQKIITTEDPVEYDLDGIVQVPVNEDIGVTYSAVLRTILRQDPDRILIGETRDLETARIAIEASLTGHLVFSTVHTNDAPSSVVRLVDLGIEPYLISGTLSGVLAQRLVRRICRDCRAPYEPTDESLYPLGLAKEDVGDKEFFFGKGCESCNHTGYRGRLALFEIMRVTPRLRKGILEGWTQSELRDLAVEEGMVPLREIGRRRIFEGLTTVEEVLRETFSEN